MWYFIKKINENDKKKNFTMKNQKKKYLKALSNIFFYKLATLTRDLICSRN